MRLDELAVLLFPGERSVGADAHGVIAGYGVTSAGKRVGVTGVAGGRPVGVEAALGVAAKVLTHMSGDERPPLVVLVDTQSQAMARRDELLGLNECLAHLTKCLALASLRGHRTVGVLHGAAAAGAFIATALATETLVAVPGAEPSVMDLPSIARVTKLSIERLQTMSATTAIFAPGLQPLTAAGAVHEVWEDPARFGAALDAVLDRPAQPDRRDRLGLARGGRGRAAPVAEAVMRAALG